MNAYSRTRNMTELTTSDYKDILNYYNEPIPRTRLQIKILAEKIISAKLCRCIKKIENKNFNSSKSIGICTRTIINRKGYSRGKFKCKGKASIKLKKIKKNNITKKNKK
jgi:hypothetical protein